MRRDAIELQDTVEVLAGKLSNGNTNGQNSDVQEDEVDSGASQHQGLGGQLLAKAESIALRHGKTAVHCCSSYSVILAVLT